MLPTAIGPIDQLISHLTLLKHRPGMFIGSDSDFNAFRCWVYGLRHGITVCGHDFWQTISQCEQDLAREQGGDFNWKSTKHWLEQHYEGKALCMAYLDFEIAIWQRIRESIQSDLSPEY